MNSGLELLGTGAVSAAVGGFFSYLTARRQFKKTPEELELATTGQAVESWKGLAESNKKHWDACEKFKEELAVKVAQQQEQILNLQMNILSLTNDINVLKLQIQGKERL